MTSNDPLHIDPEDVEMTVAQEQAESAYSLVESLRNRRLELGLRQKDVAERMGRDTSVVSNIERLGTDPRWSSIQRYATALGVVLHYDAVVWEDAKLARLSELDRGEHRGDEHDPVTAVRRYLAEA